MQTNAAISDRKESRAVPLLISKSRFKLRLLNRAADTSFSFLCPTTLCSFPHSPPSRDFYITSVLQVLMKPYLLMTSNYSKGSHTSYLSRLWLLRHKGSFAPEDVCPSLVQQLETQPCKAPLPAPPLMDGYHVDSHTLQGS